MDATKAAINTKTGGASVIEIKKCKKCNSNNFYIKEKGGVYMLYCKECNSYQCNIPKKDLEYVANQIDDNEIAKLIDSRDKNDAGVRYTTEDIYKLRNTYKDEFYTIVNDMGYYLYPNLLNDDSKEINTCIRFKDFESANRILQGINPGLNFKVAKVKCEVEVID